MVPVPLRMAHVGHRFVCLFFIPLPLSCLLGRSSLWALTLGPCPCGDYTTCCWSAGVPFDNLTQLVQERWTSRVRSISSLSKKTLSVFIGVLVLIELSVFRSPWNWWWTLSCDPRACRREWKSEQEWMKRSGGNWTVVKSECGFPSLHRPEPWTSASLTVYTHHCGFPLQR